MNIYSLPKAIALNIVSYLYADLGINKELSRDICHIVKCREIIKTLPTDNIYLIGLDMSIHLFGIERGIMRLKKIILNDNYPLDNAYWLFGKSNIDLRDRIIKRYNIDLMDDNNYVDEYPEYLD